MTDNCALALKIDIDTLKGYREGLPGLLGLPVDRPRTLTLAPARGGRELERHVLLHRLLSGGLDSCTCMAVARAAGYELYPISFDYHQRHDRELECAKRIAAHYHAAEHLIIETNMDAVGGSALTDDAIDVPEGDAERTEIPEYKAVCNAKAAEIVAGEMILPLPVAERKTYSATEIGAMFGVSAHKIGKLANKHNLKTIFPQCTARLRARIVKFCCLSDDDRAGADDHDLLQIFLARHTSLPLHQIPKLIKEIHIVVRSRRSFRMIL